MLPMYGTGCARWWCILFSKYRLGSRRITRGCNAFNTDAGML